MKRILSLLAIYCLCFTWVFAEDTDVSTLDNTIYIENITTNPGEQITISVKMKNVIQPTGFQFELVLPDGFDVVQDNEGFYLIELSTARTTAKKTDTFSSRKLSDGSYRVLCSSTNNYTFTGTDGEVATIVVNVDQNIDASDYPVILKNIELSEADGTPHKVSGTVNSTITVSDALYPEGDMNHDGKLTVDDVTLLVKKILNLK